MALHDEHILHLDVPVQEVDCVCRYDELQQLHTERLERQTPSAEEQY